jgi:hypothetical protein
MKTSEAAVAVMERLFALLLVAARFPRGLCARDNRAVDLTQSQRNTLSRAPATRWRR